MEPQRGQGLPRAARGIQFFLGQSSLLGTQRYANISNDEPAGAMVTRPGLNRFLRFSGEEAYARVGARRCPTLEQVGH